MQDAVWERTPDLRLHAVSRPEISAGFTLTSLSSSMGTSVPAGFTFPPGKRDSFARSQ